MLIKAHSIHAGDDITFTLDGRLVEGMVVGEPVRTGPNVMFDLYNSLLGQSDYGLDHMAEVELNSDTERTYVRHTAPLAPAAPAKILADLDTLDLEGFDAF